MKTFFEVIPNIWLEWWHTETRTKLEDGEKDTRPDAPEVFCPAWNR